MRKDLLRIKASAVRLGQTICFPDPSMDFEVLSIYKDGDSLTFNYEQPVKSSAYVFIKSWDGIKSAPVESLPIGEFVKRDPSSSKVYLRADYDRTSQTYQLDDYSDCSRAVYVKKGTPLFFGFTY